MVEFAAVGAEILSKIVTGGVIIIGLIFFILIILGISLYIRYLKKFNIKIRIKSLRAGDFDNPQYKIVDDWGGFIEDKKTKTRWFKLRKERVELYSPPNEALQLGADGRNHIEILQKSDTEYFYMLPDKINKKYVVIEGKKTPVADLQQVIVGGDVAYWNMLKKRDNRKLFDTESLILKVLPYIGFVLMFMLVIFLTYMITDHWGEFAAAAEALKDAAQALKEVTRATVATG